jgi:hypothetical protein
MPAVLGLLLVLFVVVGLPMLCRMAIRRMGASPGLREFINAYGPRLPFLGRDEPTDPSED